MEHWFFNDIITFFISIILAALIIPQILRVAFRRQLFDSIDGRKIHNGSVPRLGGISFFPSILLAFSAVLGFSLKYYGWDSSEDSNLISRSLCFLICAVLLMYAVGIADDVKGVRYPVKFIFQIVGAIFIVFSGVIIDDFYGFLWIHRIDSWIGWIVTAFMVLYVVNATNLIDGIDGLASGISALAFIFYAIIFYNAGSVLYSMLACAAAGTMLPFFYYNLFWNTRKGTKIFMGDTGSLTIGMLLVFCAIGMLHLDETFVAKEFNPVILGLSPLLIPLFDLVRVFINRVVHRQNPFQPDKTHIHHRLMSLGLPQRIVLSVIMVWSMIYIVVNMVLCRYINPTFVLIADIAIWIIANLIIKRYISLRNKELSTAKI